MNKKGQAGPIGMVLLFIIFIINWAVWLGAWLVEVGQTAITNNNLTGVEAFFFANLNLAIFVCMVLGIMAYLYFGGRG